MPSLRHRTTACVLLVLAVVSAVRPGFVLPSPAWAAAPLEAAIGVLVDEAAIGVLVDEAAIAGATLVEAPPACVAAPELALPSEPAPAELSDAIMAALGHPGFAGAQVGVSIWVEGFGVVAEQLADEPLLPASNQKLLTAVGALEVLGPDTTLVTEVRAAGERDGSTVHGDLVVVGAGDPTLASRGEHSVDALARAVRDAGIRMVTGRLVVDESRYDGEVVAVGWHAGHLPTYIGPTSAFTVERNRYRADLEYLVDPATGNGSLFAGALRRHGVVVTGGVARGDAPADAVTVASLSSPPIRELVATMLTRSDNSVAELLLRGVGSAGLGVGSVAGADAVHRAVLDRMCVTAQGDTADGSGLSRANRRSVSEWRELLHAARVQPWAGDFVAGLPLAGHTGTLARRFHGTVAQGTLRAKTGTLGVVRSLSGYGRTMAGRDVVFSVVVNGEEVGAAVPAIDNLLGQVLAHRS